MERNGIPIVKRNREHKILLDAHVWIWALEGNARLDIFQNSLWLKKSEIFEQNLQHILRACEYTWTKNLLQRMPKRTILATKASFERCLLSKEFQKAFEHCLERDIVFISPISIWEIGMLVEKKRIEIDMDVLDWVEHALVSGMQLSNITPRIAIQSTRLPGEVHGDPADRLLIATAHVENAVLVTGDTKILDYGKDKFVSVYNPIV